MTFLTFFLLWRRKFGDGKMYIFAAIGLWLLGLYCWMCVQQIDVEAPEFSDEDLVDDLAYRRRYGFVRRN